jgi:L-2-hydroxyglutarate oxidase
MTSIAEARLDSVSSDRTKTPTGDLADVVIVGGGIVGLATAYDLVRRFPDKRLLLLEKEPQLAAHQSGHNSGVIHSGIYYKPGSLKAQTCRAGKALLESFCRQEGIPFELCGKVIVATRSDELERLHSLADRGTKNGVRCQLIGPEQLRELEPHVHGLEAIHVPEAGRVDYPAVASRLAQRIRESGHPIVMGCAVNAIHVSASELRVSTGQGEFRARHLINCAGLHSDRVAAMTEADLPARIIPFRGEFYVLSKDAQHLVNTLVYPVPDPRFPFLGVHYTKLLSGKVKCGPNAVLALSREGYKKTDLNFRDLVESITYPGFLRMASKHWRYGLSEVVRSHSKKAFLRSLQQLVPEVRSEHLVPGPSGVRAQAVAPDGSLVDDFCFRDQERIVHVLNAPSPAATASMAIGRAIVDRLAARLGSNRK